MRKHRRLDELLARGEAPVPVASQGGAAVQAIASTSTRAALYVRVSTQAQADKFSLPAQRQILFGLAEKRDWDATLYDEGGVSAETIEARPVMEQLLADIEAGLVDCVAVVEMERLCRASDLRDWARISSTCRKAGVLVYTPERVFNLQTAEDDFEADLRGILSKREKRKLLERTKRGLEQAKDAGKFTGGQPPLGYRYDHATKRIVPVPEQFPLVKRIFESELSHWQLHRQLEKEGVYIHYETIKRMRRLPFYLGLRPDSKGKLIKADWPAIVDQELWDRQARRPKKASRRSCRPRGSAYLLSAIAKCANCGGAVVGTTDRKSSSCGSPLYHYRCYYYQKCPQGGGKVSGWRVDAAVVQALQDYAGDPERLKKRYAAALDAVQSGLVAERRAQLEGKIRDLEQRQSTLLDALERGAVSDRTARKRLDEHEAGMQDLRGQLEVLHATEYIPSIPDLQLILDLARDIPNATREDQRRLLDRLAASVVIDPKGRTVVITWRLGGEVKLPIAI